MRQSDLLYFTKRERRAILIILSVVVIWHLSFSYLKDMTVFSTDVALFEKEVLAYEHSLKSNLRSVLEVPTFDANKVSADSLILYGLKPSVAERWVNYRSALGVFSSLGDVHKIFGIDTSWVQMHKEKIVFTTRGGTTRKSNDRKPSQIHYRVFNPNKASSEDLRALGFSPLSVSAIMGYRKKGGRFKVPEDLLYIYGVDEALVRNIRAYVKIDSGDLVEEPVVDVTREPTGTDKPILDINRANVYQWQSLRGIGPVLAARIVNFRESLGGFYSISQIAETYGLPDSTFRAIVPFLKQSEVPRKIMMNKITLDSLRTHPYIDWKQSSILINYRNQHGGLTSVSDLYDIKVFDSLFIEKIAPYLSF